MATPNTPMLLSGRVPVTPLDQLSESRYQFLSLREAEPNLGNGVANSILTIQSNGNRVWANTLTLTTAYFSGNVTASNFIGNISGNISAPGTNTEVLFNDNLVVAGNINLTFDKNTATLSTVNLSIAANVTSGNLTVANNTQTNSLYVVDNANIGANLRVGGDTFLTSNTISTSGNIITSANVNVTGITGTGNFVTTGNITAKTFIGNLIGNISGDIAIPGSNTGVVVNDSGVANSFSAFTYNKVTNQLSLTGNATIGNLTTDIIDNYQINTTNIGIFGNIISDANVIGNVYANYFIGNGATLTSITGANVTGTVANALVAGTVYTNAQPNITSVGTLTSITSTGNIVSSANVTGANITTTGIVTATGNITSGANISGNFVASGSNREVMFNDNGLIKSNALLTFSKDGPTLSINSTAGTIITGYVSSLGGTDLALTPATNNLVVWGNVNPRFSNTWQLGTSTFQWKNIWAGNANISALSVTGATDITGNLSVTANISAGNISTTGLINATGNINSTSNVAGANLISNGLITATGNIVSSANVISSNVVAVQGVFAANLAAVNSVTGNNVVATSNVQANNINSNNIVSATGNIISSANVIGGNITTTGMVTATGNIVANNFIALSNISVLGNKITSGTTTGLLFEPGNVSLISGNIIVDGNYIYSQNGDTAIALVNNGEIGSVGVYNNLQVGKDGQGNLDVAGYANVTGDISVGGNSTVTGNITGANINTAGLITATANITGGNLITSGAITATGNINTANNVNAVNVNTANLVSSTVLTLTSGLTSNIVLQAGGNIVLPNTYINNLANPAQDQDAATKIYVDNLVTTGISYHSPVYAATIDTLANTTSGTITYTQPNGVSNGVGAYITTTGSFDLVDTANIQTIGTRLLVKNEGNAVLNGVYTWANSSTIVRSTDADEYGASSTEQLSLNDYFFVTNGNVNAGAAYVVNSPTGTITFGTSNITFAQFSSSQTYTAGNGISIQGVTISAKVDNNTTAFDGQGRIIVKAGANLTTPNIDSATGTSLTLTGNISANNIAATNYLSATNIDASANISGGNIISNGIASVSGNLSAANSYVAGFSNVAGNLHVFGNAHVGQDISFLASNANFQYAGTANSYVQILLQNKDNGGSAQTDFVATADNGTDFDTYIDVGINSSGFTDPAYGMMGPNDGYLYVYGNTTTNGGKLFLATATAQDIVFATGGLSNTNITGRFENGNGFHVYGNIYTANTVNAGYFIGDGSGLSNLTIGAGTEIINGNSSITVTVPNGNANITINGQSNVVVVTTAGILLDGYLSATGNITGNYFYANAVSATGNIAGDYILGNGSLLTGVITSVANINNGTSNVRIDVADGNIYANVNTLANAFVITEQGIQLGGIGNAILSTNNGHLWLVPAENRYVSLNSDQYSQLYWTSNLANINPADGNDNYSWIYAGDGGVYINTEKNGNFYSWSFYDSGLASFAQDFNVDGNTTVGWLQSGSDVIANANVSAVGNVSGNYFLGNGYYLTGVITSVANINNGTSNVRIDTSGGNIYANVGGVANVFAITTIGANVNGNLDVNGNVSSNYFIGDGSALTSISGSNVNGTVANANYATYAGTAYSVSGSNVSGTVANANYAVYSNYATYAGTAFSVSGANVSGQVSNALVAGTVYINAQPNITSVGILSSLSVSGNISGANVNAGNITLSSLANQQIPISYNGLLVGGPDLLWEFNNARLFTTNLDSNGNITVSGIVSVGGNVTAGNIITGGVVTATGNIVSTSNISGGNLTTSGIVTATGNITSSGNITGNFYFGNGAFLTGIAAGGGNNINNGNSNVRIDTAGGNVLANVGGVANVFAITPIGANVAGNLDTTGNVSAAYFIGNANASSLSSGTVPSSRLNGTYTIDIFGLASSANVVTNNAQPNITSVGTLTSLSVSGNATTGNINTGIVSASGNIIGGNLSVSGNVTSANVNAGFVTSTGNITSAANVNAANIIATANVDAANVNATNIISATGNVIAGNISTSGLITATGNITTTGNSTANYFLGNGSLLTGIITSVSNINNGTSNIRIETANANILANVGGTANVLVIANSGLYVQGLLSVTSNITTGSYVLATGNVTGGNLITSGLASVTGNVNSGNVNTSIVSATGNIIGGNITTAGLVTATGNIISTANVTGGNITTAGLVTATGNIVSTANVTGGNITTAGLVTATGNVTGGNIIAINALIGNSANVNGDAIIAGNLTVGGNTNYINVTNLNIQDPIIGIGRGANNAPLTTNDGKDRGEQLWYYSATENSSFVGYKNATGKLIAATNVSIANEVVTVNSYGNFLVGNLEASIVSSSGNVTAVGNVTGGNLITTGIVTATGNITTSGYYFGNGASLTGVPTFSSVYYILSVQGNVTGNSTANATLTAANSTGILYPRSGNGIQMAGNATSGVVTISEIGSVNDGTIFGGGGTMDLVSDPTTQTQDLGLVTDLVLTSQYTLNTLEYGTPSSFDSLTIDNLTTSNIIGTASVNITTANVVSANNISTGNVTATGNVTGNYFLGNGSLLTGVITSTGTLSNGNSNVNIATANGNVSFSITGNSNVIVVAAGQTNIKGNLVPDASNIYSLGTSSLRWSNLWVSGSTITLGNIVLKDNGASNLAVYGSNGTTPANVVGQIINSQAFAYNTANITATGNISNAYNALSGGPITINDGITVTVDNGAYWTIS